MTLARTRAQPSHAPVTDDTGRITLQWASYLRDLSEGSVGDYRASINPPGGGWLPCDGSLFLSAQYPALAAVISGRTGGDGAGNFNLPNIPPVYDDSHPAPNGPPVMSWFIKAR